MKLARNTFIAIIALYILINSLVWLLSPWLTRTFAEDFLSEHNIVMDSKSKVRVNLYNSSLNIQNVALIQDDQSPYSLDSLTLNYSFWRLFKKEVVINAIHLNGMNLNAQVNGNKIIIAGFDLDNFSDQSTTTESLTQEDDSEQITGEPLDNADQIESENSSFVDSLSYLAPEILLENIQVNLTNEGHEHSLIINKLALQKSEYRNFVLETSIEFDALFDGAKLDLISDITTDLENAEAEINIDIVNLDTSKFKYLLPPEINQLDLLFSTHINLNVNYENEAISIISSSLELQLDSLKMKDAIYDVSFDQFAISIPVLNAKLNQDVTEIEADSLVQITLNKLKAGFSQSESIISSVDQFNSSELELTFSINGDDIDYNVFAPLIEIKGLVGSQVAQSQPELVSLDYLKVSELTATPQLVKLKNFDIGSGQTYVILDKDYELETLFNIDVLLGEDLTETAISEAEGENAVDDQVLANNDEMPSLESQNSSNAQQVEIELLEPQIQIESITLNNPINIHIQDNSLETPFTKLFILDSVLIEDIDSNELKKQTRYQLAFSDDAYFTGTAKGWVKPFTEKLNLDAKVILKEFPLHEVAPYLKDSLGFEVKAGQMDFELGAGINEDSLLSDAVILLRGAQFGESEKLEGAGLIGKTAIPLNVALGMLRDKHGNIELKVPVNGDVYDPSFGLNNIVGLVVKKVVMSQAKSYLINTFVPYASVVKVALSAGELALKVRIADLDYQSGQINISESQAEYIEQITALLKDKESLSISVCPVGTVSDLIHYQPVQSMDEASAESDVEFNSQSTSDETINNNDSNNMSFTEDTEIKFDQLTEGSLSEESPSQEPLNGETVFTESIEQETGKEIELVIFDYSAITSDNISPQQYEFVLEVAKKRAENFKAQLVEQGSIDSSRLLLCSPKFEKKEKGLPRIEFGT